MTKDKIVRHGLPIAGLGPVMSPTPRNVSHHHLWAKRGRRLRPFRRDTPNMMQLTNALELSSQELALEVSHRPDSIDSSLKSKATATGSLWNLACKGHI